jgi:WD40 repeat protein
LVDRSGLEAGSYVGHTDTPIKLCPISEQVFISAADDRSIKIWDIRQHAPIGHIGTNNRSVMALSCSPNHVIFELNDRWVCAVDIHGPKYSPVVGVSMEEYGADAMFYDIEKDSLSLFAQATQEGSNDSLLFIDVEGSSRKYIFRKYPNFLHL